jgi:hypothetical protein
MKTVKERLARIETTQYFILVILLAHVGIAYIPLLLAILL